MEQPIKKKVAILGATGYIGRSMVATANANDFQAVPFSRDVTRAAEIFYSYSIVAPIIFTYENFLNQEFEIVVNATGVGSPREIIKDPNKVFSVTEEMDALLFSYLEKHPNTRVFNISSGSVYGLSARQEISNETLATFNPEQFGFGDYYSLAKLHSEAKHRALLNYHIVDLRVFAFISRWLDHEESFFIAEVAKCLLTKKTFYTRPDDMVRDYCTANDLWEVINFLSKRPRMNEVFNMKSLSPVTKFELLNKLKDEADLEFGVEDIKEKSPTGSKKVYAPKESRLEALGYCPQKTSLESVIGEIKGLLSF